MEQFYRWVKATKDNVPKEFGLLSWRDARTKWPISANNAYREMRKERYDSIEFLELVTGESEGGGVWDELVTGITNWVESESAHKTWEQFLAEQKSKYLLIKK